MRKKLVAKITLVLFPAALFFGVALISPKQVGSGTLTSAKDTLSNSRLSYHGLISGAHSAGWTTITIKSSGAPDNNTNHLFPGDTVKIGPAANSTRTVGTIIDTTHFTITSGLTAALVDSDPVISTQSAIHSISFTTATAVKDGLVRVRITSATSNYNDGLPDQTGFDFNSITGSNVTCPTGSVDIWESATASYSGQNNCPSGYSCFECRFSGTLPASTAKTMTIGDASKKLINPSPKSGHSQGTADIYTTIIEIMDKNANLVDSVTAKTAVIESTLVSATVDATLSFSVAANNSGVTRCGQTTSVATTVSTVPFGTLAASTFYDAAQTLTVSTNASSGYAVTIEEDNQMGKDGGTTTEIPDTTCDDGTCTHVVKANWATATATVSGAYGLGYSLENVSGTDAAFTYNQWQTYLAKQIPCTSAAGACGTQDTAQTIMSNSGPVSAKQVYVCYRIDISGTQQAGYYYNKVMYIATPTF